MWRVVAVLKFVLVMGEGQPLGPLLLPQMRSHVSDLFKEQQGTGYQAKDGATNRWHPITLYNISLIDCAKPFVDRGVHCGFYCCST